MFDLFEFDLCKFHMAELTVYYNHPEETLPYCIHVDFINM